MRRALQALFLCLAILSGIVGTASGAYVDATSKNSIGVSGPNPDIHTYILGSLELEPQRGDTILGYDVATGVVFYVNQNPWTKFDPLGLEEEGFWTGVSNWLSDAMLGAAFSNGDDLTMARVDSAVDGVLGYAVSQTVPPEVAESSGLVSPMKNFLGADYSPGTRNGAELLNAVQGLALGPLEARWPCASPRPG